MDKQKLELIKKVLELESNELDGLDLILRGFYEDGLFQLLGSTKYNLWIKQLKDDDNGN